MRAAKRAGDLPAWVAIIAGLLVPLMAAVAAWGATGARLEAHDAELVRIEQRLHDVNQRLARIEGYMGIPAEKR